MKTLLLTLLLITGYAYAQSGNIANKYQALSGTVSSAAPDTITISGYNYFKFTLTGDSTLHYTWTSWGASDSATVKTGEIWNQPDWLNGKIFTRLIISGGVTAIAYRLWLSGIH